MTTHTIKNGLDLPLAGKPECKLVDAPEPAVVALATAEFPGIKPKVLVKEGDLVKTGQPLFLDKVDRDIVWCSPATGTVQKLEFGERRFLLKVVVTNTGKDEFAPMGRPDASSRDALIKSIKNAGLWPLFVQRPLGKMPRSAAVPAAIFVNGMNTEPLACDPALAVRGQGAAFQAGLDLLKRLTDGKVYLSVRDAVVQPAEFVQAKGVETHTFSGPHPAGLVGTHIRFIQPLKTGQIAYALNAQDVAAIGQWVKTGHFPTHVVVAVVGSRAPKRGCFRVRRGAAAFTLTGGKPLGDDTRVIAGTVLNGAAIGGAGFLGYHTQTLTCIPEGSDRRDLFGWALPGVGKHSASRAVLSWLAPKKEYDLDARLHGGPRAIVNIGQWEAMTPLDVLPTFLVRAIQAKDLEEAISLGLLEVTEEDVALCTFADPCKIDVGAVIRAGLDMFEKEGG